MSGIEIAEDLPLRKAITLALLNYSKENQHEGDFTLEFFTSIMTMVSVMVGMGVAAGLNQEDFMKIIEQIIDASWEHEAEEILHSKKKVAAALDK